jgi:hypothetical protein
MAQGMLAVEILRGLIVVRAPAPSPDEPPGRDG